MAQIFFIEARTRSSPAITSQSVLYYEAYFLMRTGRSIKAVLAVAGYPLNMYAQKLYSVSKLAVQFRP